MKISRILSNFFSPLFIPTYAVAIAMWVTPLRVLPERNRLIVTLIIALITGLIPAAILIALRAFGIVKDLKLLNHRERPIPMIVWMVCYIAAALFLSSLHAPRWLPMFFYGAAIAAAVAAFISIWWKISAHTAAMGGLVGLMAWFAVASLADVNAMVLLSASILALGAVASARVAMGRHTLSQTAAGGLLGFAATFLLTAAIC